MKLLQIGIVLPLNLQQLNIGESYMNWMLDADTVKDSNEHIKIEEPLLIQNTNFLLKNKISKQYYLCQSLPKFVQELIGQGKYLKISIDSISDSKNPNQNQIITVTPFQKLQIEFSQVSLLGDNPIFSPFDNIEQADIKDLDVINQTIPFFLKYSTQISQTLISNFAIQNQQHWKEQLADTQKCTVYKRINIACDYGQESETIESFIIEEIQSFFIYYYKSMLLMLKYWESQSQSQIDQNNLIIQQNSCKDQNISDIQTLEQSCLFNVPLFNVNDIYSFTNFKSIKKHYFSNTYLPKQIKQSQQQRVMTEKQHVPDDFYSIQGSNAYENQNKIDFSENYMVQNNKQQIFTGTLYKKGAGPFDYNWNQRFVVIEGNTLMYYTKTPRGMIKLKDGETELSEIKKIDDRDFAFEINIEGKSYQFSGETKDDTYKWRQIIQSCLKKNQQDILQDGTEYKIEDTPENDKQEVKIVNNEQENISEKKKKKQQKVYVNDRQYASKYETQNLHPDLQFMKEIFPSADNLPNEKWMFLKYINQVKIFKYALNQGVTYSKRLAKQSLFQSKQAMYVIFIINAILLFIYGINRNVVILSLIGFSYIFASKNLKQKYPQLNDSQFIGQMIFEEESKNLFRKLKNNKFTSSWDLLIKNRQKIIEQPHSIKLNSNHIKTQQAKIQLIQRNSSSQSFDALSTKHTLHYQAAYIIFEKTEAKEIDLEIWDLYIIQQFPKISGMCKLSLYSKMTFSSQNLSKRNMLKIQMQRIKNLPYINNLLDNEVLYRNLNLNDEDQNSEQEINENIQQNQLSRGYSVVSQQQQFHISQNAIQAGSPPNIQLQSQKQNQQQLNIQNFQKQNISDIVNEINLLKKNNLLDQSKRKTLEQLKPGYKQYKDGGLESTNKEEAKSQEGVILEIMGTVGSTIMRGEALIGISLPVRIFEPRSTLERLCDSWSLLPLYMANASCVTDPLERMKLVISFAIGGLYLGTKQLKPFNPLLGETYQGHWIDGTSIEIEHISHHPPIASFYIENKDFKYRFTGNYEFKVQVKSMGNMALVEHCGPNNVYFADGGHIEYHLPVLRCSNLVMGTTRFVDFIGDIVFTDTKNHLSAKIKFYEGGGLFSKAKHKTDHFEGAIIKNNDEKNIVSRVEGSWLEYVEFDGVRYWDLQLVHPLPFIKIKNPLPSDCRYREDIINLAKNDIVKAQESKVRLEVIQRGDRKLRQLHGPEKH